MIFTKGFLLLTFFVLGDFHYYRGPRSTGHGVSAASTGRSNDRKDLTLTINERDKLHLLRGRVRNKLPEYYMHTDFYLIRWLRARNYNIDQAEKMLLENIRWRQENRMNVILKEDFSDILDEYPLTLDSHDRKGRPVGTINFGSWDIAGGVVQGKMARIMRLMDYFLEHLVHQVIEAQESGKKVSRAVVLVDNNGLNILQHACPSCVHSFVRMIVSMETHYPGFWEEIIVVNAPSLFRVLLDGVKTLLSPNTRDVFTLFDGNKKLWIPYLDERITRDQRYENFGGVKSEH